MQHTFAQLLGILTAILAVAGIGYFLAALIAARIFLSARSKPLAAFTPGVSILKSLKGLDPGMIDAFRSHCRQSYAGEFELLFGVASRSDPAAAAVQQLQAEFPNLPIKLIECLQRLGTNGKVSSLVQLVPHASHNFLLINDSDITVSPRYLERVMACFTPETTSSETPQATEKFKIESVLYQGGTSPGSPSTGLRRWGGASVVPQMPQKNAGALAPEEEVGLVTALYRGRAHHTLASTLEALGIATDFHAGVLLSKWIEGGLHYGLGSTLAVRRDALDKIGGLLPLVDHLADDYELGARIFAAGYRVALSDEVVETNIAAYGLRGFLDHQLRWARTVRDARPWGYAGLIFTHGLGWALLNVVASGASLLSLWLLGLSFCLRIALAMTVGAEVLSDRQVLPCLWLLPLRDIVAMGVWVAGFAGNTIVWRGERFSLKNGKLEKPGR
jgi:ceramide glucosyltransferase